MRISDWSSDVCSSDLVGLCGGAGRYPHRRAHRHTSLVQREQQRVEADRLEAVGRKAPGVEVEHAVATEVGDPVGLLGEHLQPLGRRLERAARLQRGIEALDHRGAERRLARSEEHTSELQYLLRISYAVFCLKK